MTWLAEPWSESTATAAFALALPRCLVGLVICCSRCLVAAGLKCKGAAMDAQRASALEATVAQLAAAVATADQRAAAAEARAVSVEARLSQQAAPRPNGAGPGPAQTARAGLIDTRLVSKPTAYTGPSQWRTWSF